MYTIHFEVTGWWPHSMTSAAKRHAEKA